MTELFERDCEKLKADIAQLHEIIEWKDKEIQTLRRQVEVGKTLRERISIALNDRHPLMAQSLMCAVFDYDAALRGAGE